MKTIKNFLIVVGLFLEVGNNFVVALSADEAQAIRNRIAREKPDPDWKATGPTQQDILASTQVESQIVKGSLEDKLVGAVKNGDLEKVKDLIAAGANLEVRDSQGMSVFIMAAEKGYAGIMKMFIDAGVNVKAADRFGCTALFHAANKNYSDIVRILIENDAADTDNLEAFFVQSVFIRNVEMVKVLVVAHAKMSPSVIDTAYMMAQGRGNSEIFNIIVEALNKKS